LPLGASAYLVMDQQLASDIYVLHLPLIWTSMNPGLIIHPWQSIHISAVDFSSKKIFSGLIMTPSRTQRFSWISWWFRNSKQFVSWTRKLLLLVRLLEGMLQH
jgi:hypothetical protein